MKLANNEPGKPELEAFVEGRFDRMSSLLAIAESRRAVRRPHAAAGAEAYLDRLLAEIDYVPMDRALMETAGRLEPPGLRSLDAIHLASALSLGVDLDAIVTYDRRLALAARRIGVRVFPEPSEN